MRDWIFDMIFEKWLRLGEWLDPHGGNPYKAIGLGALGVILLEKFLQKIWPVSESSHELDIRHYVDRPR